MKGRSIEFPHNDKGGNCDLLKAINDVHTCIARWRRPQPTSPMVVRDDRL
jgi:hypothetical protein